MMGNRHGHEGNIGDSGEPKPGSYWKRVYRDWRVWIGAILMLVPISMYVLVAIWHGFRLFIGFPRSQVDYQQSVSGGGS
jgi:hypothetical protein